MSSKASFLDANVVKILVDPKKEWLHHRRKTLGAKRFASFDKKVDWQVFNPQDYLFTHSTIVSSVKVEPNGYTIVDPCHELINANGNAWSNEVLMNCFKTFIGKPNFYEHFQIQGFEKGVILDSILRPVTYVGSNGKTADVFYCDLLIATNRKHDDIVKRIINGQLSTLSMGCFLENGKVNLSDSTYKNIKNIEIGDLVLTHKGNIKKVTELFSYDVVDIPLYKIDAFGMDDIMEITGEHPVLICKKEDVSCVYKSCKRPCKLNVEQSQCFNPNSIKSACAGKRKPCGRDKNNYEYKIDFVPVSEVKKGDYLLKTFPTEVYDNESFSKEHARLFGMYLGDGSFSWLYDKETKEKRYPYAVRYTFNIKEKELVNLVLDCVNKIDKNIDVNVDERNEYNAVCVTVNSKELAQLFFELGGEYSDKKIMNKSIMFLPKEKQLEIIGGMFDTDGCFYEKTKIMNYSTSSSYLFNQLHIMMLRCGIGNSQHTVFRKPSKTGFKKGTDKYYEYNVSVQKSYVGMIKSFKNKLYGEDFKNTNDVCFFYKNYYMCPIKDIKEETFTGKVYNFSVEDDESYCVNNMAVHNCTCSIVQCSYCGKIFEENDEECEHLQNHIGELLLDQYGHQVPVAELIGVMKDGKFVEGSCEFIEASWVEQPAFEGAVLNQFLYEEDIKKNLEAQRFARFDFNSYFNYDTLNQLRVADKYSYVTIQLLKEQLLKEKYLNIAKEVYKSNNK